MLGSFVHAAAPCWTAVTPPSEMPVCPGVVCHMLTAPVPISKPNQRTGRLSLACRYWQTAGAVTFSVIAASGAFAAGVPALATSATSAVLPVHGAPFAAPARLRSSSPWR